MLERFQREMLTDFFAGTRESLILVPKKNGKTTLLGALALFHLCTTPDADCVIAAASRKQAEKMLQQARGFIRRSPELSARIETKQRELEHRTLGGKVQVLASDVDTMDGWGGTLAFIDELHRHRREELYGLLRDGLGPRKGQMVTISTAGDDADSPLGRLRRDALALPGLERVGPHTTARKLGFVMHEWALDDSADFKDLDVVKEANPASWQSIAALRERRESPSMTEWQWRRFACGQWVAGEDSAISPQEWRACAVEPPDTSGVSWTVGIDIGLKWDTTALVPICDVDGVLVVGRPDVLVPPRDGTSLDVEDIVAAFERMCEVYDVGLFVIDPEAGGELIGQRIERELGVPVAVHSQKASPMALAAQRFHEVIAARRIVHPDDTVLNAHVLAAARRPGPGEGWRLEKPRKGKKVIDACVALAMAVSVLVGERNTTTLSPSDYLPEFV